MRVRKILKEIDEWCIKIFLLFTSIILGFMTSSVVTRIIKPSDTHGALNQYTDTGFSPEQNFTQIIWIVVISLLGFGVLLYIRRRFPAYLRLLMIAIVALLLFVSTLIPGVTRYAGHIDTFHHGEQLSPANDFLNGKKLYSDMFVLHGAGEDVIVPALALKLSKTVGNGIGNYFFIVTSLRLIATVIFLWLLSKLFDRDSIFIALAVWFSFGVYSDFNYVRDIFTWIMLGLAFKAIFDNPAGRHRSYLLYIGIGALSALGLFYAIDRGIIITGIAAFVGLVDLFTKRVSGSSYKFTLPNRIERFENVSLILAGAVCVNLIVIMVIGFSQYKEFLVTYFGEIPKSQGLLFNYPLPPESLQSFPLWLPVVLAVLTIIMLVELIGEGLSKNRIRPTYIFATLLTVSGLVFLRIGYGRSDWGHIAYATPMIFLALFYVAYLYIQKFGSKMGHYWPIITILVLLTFPVNSIDPSRIISLANASPRAAIDFVKLPSRPDSYWVPEDVQRVSDYIKGRSKPSEPIFVFTQQPIYYYLTDRRNPTRFYIPWFADPNTLEDEMLYSLKMNPPKIIVYLSGSGWDKVDGFTMSDRTPKVKEWIFGKYKHSHTIQSITLLEE